MNNIVSEVKQLDELYNKLLNVVIRDFPKNNMDRVKRSQLYLKNILLNYDQRKQGLPANKVRGVCAEVMMEIIMRYYKTLNSNIVVMKNLLIPLEDGSTTQLDFLLVTPTNIIVIEVKSLFGLLEIDGEEITSRWMTSKGDWNSNTIRPWKQNMLHIIALKKYLGASNVFMHNLVFLFSIGEIRKYVPKEDNHLMTYDDFEAKLKELTNKNLIVIPKNQMTDILSKLVKAVPTNRQEVNHIKDLQKKHK